ncbi:MAG: hypothetical protein IJY87_04625 [Bacilli bacterium]|nr:hypothetical protein [Bacilli bacterium]
MKKVFNLIILFISLFIFTIEVNAVELVDKGTLVPGTWQGNSSSGSYKTLWNISGTKNNFTYGQGPFILVSDVIMSVIDGNVGDTFRYILEVQICQRNDDYNLTWDTGSVKNQISDITLLGYNRSSSCNINVYEGNLVSYFYLVSGNLVSYSSPESNVGFTNQNYVLRWGSYLYNEFSVRNVFYQNYTQELYNSIINSNQNQTLIDQNQQQLQQDKEQHEEAQETRKGIWDSIKSVLNAIVNLPGKIIELLIDALKLLFIPTDSQIQEVIDESQNMAENFGFIGQIVNFVVEVFTSIISVVQSEGCIDFPELTLDFSNTPIGKPMTLWKGSRVCMAENAWFGTDSSSIQIVRTITTLTLMLGFVNFAYVYYFKVLSKED